MIRFVPGCNCCENGCAGCCSNDTQIGVTFNGITDDECTDCESTLLGTEHILDFDCSFQDGDDCRMEWLKNISEICGDGFEDPIDIIVVRLNCIWDATDERHEDWTWHVYLENEADRGSNCSTSLDPGGVHFRAASAPYACPAEPCDCDGYTEDGIPVEESAMFNCSWGSATADIRVITL